MRLVDVRCDNDLHFVAKSFSHKSESHAVYQLRRKIRVGLERLDVVDSLDAALTDSRQGFVKFVVGVVLVNILHVQICVLDVCEAVQRVA